MLVYSNFVLASCAQFMCIAMLHMDIIRSSINDTIRGIRNMCAASGCLSFPDASWEKSQQLFHQFHWNNMQFSC